MTSDLFGFLRTRPRLAKTTVLVLLVAGISMAAYLGLQIHIPAQSGGESILEWTAFLAALAGCLAVLLGAARIWGSFEKSANASRSGPEPADE